eukprot:1864866-Pyramimonas_sp.AAC.1
MSLGSFGTRMARVGLDTATARASGARAHSRQQCARRTGVLIECAVARGMSAFSLLFDIKKAH